MAKLAATLLLSLLLSGSALADEVLIRYRIIDFIEETYKISNAYKIVNKVFDISREKNLDPLLVLGIIATESSFNENAKSSAQAYGLMQVHWPSHRDKFQTKSDVFTIDHNLNIGMDIWRQCTTRNKDMRLAANCYSGGHENWLSSVRKNQRAFKQLIKDI